MKNLTKPDELLDFCRRFTDESAVGFLLSGGCDKNGEMLNLRKLLPTVKQIKQDTNLIIKLHTGFVDKELAKGIVDAGVDIASVEVVGSDETIQEIFDYDAAVESYTQTLINLQEAGMPYIVPHVCIGLHYGKLKGEIDALKVIKKHCDPALIVLIIFRSTKGTELEQCTQSSPEDISYIVTKTKELFPGKEISLGCIRPRAKLRQDIESAALQAGVTRMEIPSKTTLHQAEQMGYTIRTISACCALPIELESRAIL
jgi:uncharacterized radical SAM superfamily protein